MKTFDGFVEFVREQGVVGLAVGFILGGSVSKMVTSIVNDILNPIIGAFLGAAGDLRSASFMLGSTKIAWGSFLGTCIDFVVICMVAYFGVKFLHLDRLDKKKEK
ncbi:MAG: MscL family protein [Candidatus Kerfeldbacteria bacterium]|nr:MscL family protein [Candidatus Kerfeldbacteria bacterium]